MNAAVPVPIPIPIARVSPAPSRSDVKRVLVCDGEQRSALAVVRSLGQRAHMVAVCSHEPRCLSSASRWASRAFEVPDPRLEPDRYAKVVRKIARDWSADVVLPVTDPSCLALLGRRDEFAPAIIPGPTLEAFIEISDKARLLSRAKSLGVPTPDHVVVDGRDNIDRSVGTMEGPFAIKPFTTLTGAYQRVLYAESRDDLRKQLLETADESFPLLVQRRIIGPGVGVFILVHNGRPVATFAHERVREHPPSGGASVYSRSATVPPKVMADALRLLNSHGWSGAAMIEFKRERSTGTHFLMEVNGRLWGSLQLAIDAGVDFPALIVDIAGGCQPRPVDTYSVGVSLRSFWRDLDHLLARLRHSPERLNLPPGSRGRMAALIDFFSVARGEHLELLRLSDPAPFVHASIRYAKSRLGFA
jgi:predicted ATP-grasp superfamily ATP-dependent carboligase